MKKKQILNICMVLIIALIAVSGIMVVKSTKGTKSSNVPATAEIESEAAEDLTASTDAVKEETKQTPIFYVQNRSGIVTVERKGIAYEIEENSELRNDDILRTKAGSTITISDGKKESLSLGENSQLSVNDIDELSFSLENGELFADTRDAAQVISVEMADQRISANEAVYTLTAQPAAYTIYVYAGSVSVNGETLFENVMAEAGQVITLLADENGKITAETNKFSASALSDQQINGLLACTLDSSFCFQSTDLQKVLDSREAEKASILQEKAVLQEQAKAELLKEQQEYEDAEEAYQAAIENGEAFITEDEAGNIVVESSGGGRKYCTIQIRCDTILNNMDNLTPGKEGYVPGSGKILSTTEVAFSDGDTVFDVLKSVCSLAGIQLEYSWTPLYNSYYIEGINNLYEFDCGAESGWMYKVNGWFPNYGCSSYTVEEGDMIVWTYTCEGLGADVGGNVH